PVREGARPLRRGQAADRLDQRSRSQPEGRPRRGEGQRRRPRRGAPPRRAQARRRRRRGASPALGAPRPPLRGPEARGAHLGGAGWRPAAPTDSRAIDVKSAKAAPLRAEARPSAELAPVDVKIDEVKAFDGQSIPVLVYLPAGLPAGKKLPTIVNYHGGPAGVSGVRWVSLARVLLSLRSA